MLVSISEGDVREGLLGAILFRAGPDMVARCAGGESEFARRVVMVVVQNFLVLIGINHEQAALWGRPEKH